MLDTAEKLPIIRFSKTAELDKVATEQAGRTQYKDVIKVFLRAPGDIKTEFPDVAETVKYKVTTSTQKVERDHTVWKENDEGMMEEVTEKIVVPEEKRLYSKEVVTPWLDKQKERLHNGKITQNYYDYCVDAFNRFKRDEDQPIDGTPLAMWGGAPESVKKAAIECGIRSVEAAAEMTTEAMGAIGMGAMDLKNNAKAYIETNLDANSAALKLNQLEQDNADKDERLSQLEAKLAELIGDQDPGDDKVAA